MAAILGYADARYLGASGRYEDRPQGVALQTRPMHLEAVTASVGVRWRL